MKSLPRFACAAIFVLAMIVMILEVAMTRIFSVVTYHHFTYLVIGLALLGFGAAGTVLTVHRRFDGPTINSALLADCAWMFGLVLMICFVSITKIGFDAMALYQSHDILQLLYLLLLLIMATLPFFFGGLCIGYLISLLVFSGIGSFIAKELRDARLWVGGASVLVVLAPTIVATVWFLDQIVPNLMGLNHTARCVLAVVAVMPVGLLMGMPFPSGIRMAKNIDPALVPWAWSINACATVLGSVASILVAMFVGFTMVTYCAALIYLVAMWAFLRVTGMPTVAAPRLASMEF